MLFFLQLILVILLHIYFLNFYFFNSNISDSKQLPIIVKIKVKEKQSLINHKIFNFYNSKSILSNFNAENYNLKSNQIFSNSENKLYELINDQLTTPSFLSDYGIHGIIKCNIIITKNKLDFTRSKCLGNSILKTIILETINNVIKTEKVLHNIIQTVYFNLERSTATRPIDLNQQGKEFWYFYRHQYGASTNSQKIYAGFLKILRNLTQWPSILEYLPKSKNQILSERQIIMKYLNSPLANI